MSSQSFDLISSDKNNETFELKFPQKLITILDNLFNDQIDSFGFHKSYNALEHSKFINDYGRTDLDYERLKYSKYPIGSVPVKVVLGKIKKIENPYLPRLHLAFLDEGKNFISLNDHLLCLIISHNLV